jgi:SpoVK/Ycf46/Vps4 family AAA+-type ATPase
MMNPTKALEPVLRDATIKAIDGVAKKLGEAERTAESKVARLLTYWNDMEKEDKEQAVGIAIATITTAVTAIVALKRKRSPVKAVVKAVVKKKMR